MSPAKSASARQVAEAYFKAISKRDAGAMAACWKAGGVDHLYGMADLRAPGGIQAWFADIFASFPDFEMQVVEMVAYGDKAAVRWKATGTFNGAAKFQGIAPTGASIDLEGLDLLTIADGQITANHAYTNAAELARQLGAMPPEGSVGEKAMLGLVNARTQAKEAIARLRER